MISAAVAAAAALVPGLMLTMRTGPEGRAEAHVEARGRTMRPTCARTAVRAVAQAVATQEGELEVSMRPM